MYTHTCMYTHICTHIHAHTYMHTHTCTHIHVHAYMYTHACTYIHTCTHIHAHIYTYMIYMYIHLHAKEATCATILTDEIGGPRAWTKTAHTHTSTGEVLSGTGNGVSGSLDTHIYIYQLL